MRQLIKYFLWIGCLALGLQSAAAFSLLGPVGANGTTGGAAEDNWQITEIGYNPLANGGAPPFFTDLQVSGPKNLGEGYRLNTPVLYYTFDPDFGYFGSNGEAAVVSAFAILNNLTNVDSYSTNLTEFPLSSENVNYQAQTLGLLDLKSETLSIMMEQMGLADAVRYTWGLLDRYIPPRVTCPGPGMDYYVIQRNFDITASPLSQIQYSSYVNAELYYYTIYENCDAAGASPPTADALEYPADSSYNNPPVASGHGEDFFSAGAFYTGLTRDDVAGLRYLLSTNNVFAPGVGYLEPPASGSVVLSGGGGLTTTNLNDQFTLITSNLTALVLASATNNPAALQTLYPGLVITSVRTNFFSGTYVYTFGNVYTNNFYTNTTIRYQVVSSNITPAIGWPAGTMVTNVTTNTTIVQSNLVSGDFLLIPTNTCGLDILQVLATNVAAITNTLATVTNITSSSSNYITTNIVLVSTNYTLLVAPCEFLTSTGGTNANVGDYQGIGRVQFVRVSDDNYDYQTGQFYRPLTNYYSMVVMRNGAASPVSFERVVTRPDIVFQGEELAQGSGNAILLYSALNRTTPNFLDSRATAGLAGPGIIDPTSGTNVTITFNTVGPYYVNISSSFLNGPRAAAGRSFIWGSFDGSTNAPVLYPNGTSIANLAAEALIRISPPAPALPNGTRNTAYNVTLTATGGQPPYMWALAPGSAGLPPGLSVSSGGVISGTPTNSATYLNIVIQMTDSTYPSTNVVDTTYSLTIN
jgi:hypothetical protein